MSVNLTKDLKCNLGKLGYINPEEKGTNLTTCAHYYSSQYPEASLRHRYRNSKLSAISIISSYIMLGPLHFISGKNICDSSISNKCFRGISFPQAIVIIHSPFHELQILPIQILYHIILNFVELVKEGFQKHVRKGENVINSIFSFFHYVFYLFHDKY